MSIFNNNLKPEEEFGGFIPGSQEDDTFYLEKLDTYNGILPDFSYEDTAISDLILEQLDPEAVAKRSERKEQEKNSFGSDYSPEVIAEPTYLDDSLNQDFENLKNLGVDELNEGKVNEPPKWGDDYFNSSPEENNIEEDEELNFATSIPKESKSDNLVDDDLKQLLKSELARSEVRKQANESNDDFDEDIESKSNRLREIGGAYVSPFGDVASFEEHPEIMDFDDIHADSPSTFGLKELNTNEEKNTNEEVSSKKDKKEKKTKKPMSLWQIIAISAAAVVIIGALITLGVIKFVNDPTFMRFGSSKSESSKTTINEKSNSKKHKEIKVVESKAVQKDTLKEEHKEVAEVKPEKEEPIKEVAIKENIKKINIAELDRKIVKKEIPAKKKSFDLADLKPTKEKIERPNVEKSKNEKPEKIKDIKPVVKKEPKQLVNQSNDDEDNVKPSFAVQIYATPSMEDAEDWVKKLKQKSAKNVRIDSQMIRDVKWFRVRFGDFENKEDAKSAALKLGFAQSWIDRVK